MEVITAEPKMVKSLLLPLQEIRILPICDIQFGAQGSDLDRLARHLKWGVDNDCYFLGLGDYVDVASPSNRQTLRSVLLYDSVREMMDQMGEKHLKDMQDILAPTRGRWLGLLTGHHVWEFEDGTNTDSRLAQFLGCPYLGDGAAVLLLKLRDARGRHASYGTAKIWAHHGVGSAQRGVPPVLYNVAQRFLANAYLMGHQTRKAADKIPLINYEVTARGKIIESHTNRVLAVCGGFHRGYLVGQRGAHGLPKATYVEKGMMAPTALGGVMIWMRPKQANGRIVIDTDISY